MHCWFGQKFREPQATLSEKNNTSCFLLPAGTEFNQVADVYYQGDVSYRLSNRKKNSFYFSKTGVLNLL